MQRHPQASVATEVQQRLALVQRRPGEPASCSVLPAGEAIAQHAEADAQHAAARLSIDSVSAAHPLGVRIGSLAGGRWCSAVT